MKHFSILAALIITFSARAQEIKVEGDKKADLSQYKTFRFGEGEITTPKDERVTPDATVHKWIRAAMEEEMSDKGFARADSADLVISYLIGSEKRSDPGQLGPLGMTTGSGDRNYVRDYQAGTLIIDVNDAHSNKLIWRINATTNTNQQEGDKLIDEIIERGFKKFPPQKKKQKKLK